jgi:hypothetical protein
MAFNNWTTTHDSAFRKVWNICAWDQFRDPLNLHIEPLLKLHPHFVYFLFIKNRSFPTDLVSDFFLHQLFTDKFVLIIGYLLFERVNFSLLLGDQHLLFDDLDIKLFSSGV